MSERLFAIEPWAVREKTLHLDRLAETESMFALSNGHIGLRGNLDEGEPHGIPGTYLNSVYELRPLPYARGRLRLSGGRPEHHQHHQRQADPAARRRRALRRPLRRSCASTSGARPAGRHARAPSGVGVARRVQRPCALDSSRVAQPARHRRDPATRSSRVDDELRIVVQSELVANEAMPDLGKRSARGGGAGLAPRGRGVDARRRRRGSWCTAPAAAACRVAAAMQHNVEGPGRHEHRRHVRARRQPGHDREPAAAVVNVSSW